MAQKTIRKASPASAAKKPKSAPSRRSTAVRVGGKKSSNKLVNFLTSGNKRWIALVAFVLVFGAIGAYYLQNSRAALSVSNHYCTSTPTLRLTSPYTRGDCVKKLQASLNAANGAGLSVDGVFGPASKTAVYNFQVKHGLLRDGIAGSQTWGKLDYFIDWFTPGTTSGQPPAPTPSDTSYGQPINPSSVYSSSRTRCVGNYLHPVYKTWRRHNGIDFGAPSGTRILAVKSGKVVASTSNSSAGNYVKIDHGGGVTSTSMHMRSRAVATGATVAKGQVIGYVGTTGTSTSDHLHFEMRGVNVTRGFFDVIPMGGFVNNCGTRAYTGWQ